MFYSIVYGRQFIKTKSGKIIPLVLIGDSNVYESSYTGRWRRSRNWGAAYTAGMNERLEIDAEELMKKIKSFVPSAYNEHFKFRGKWVDDKGLISFFKNGIKQAKTIEELKETYVNAGELKGYLMVFDRQNRGWKYEMVTPIHNSDELDDFLKKAYERIDDKKNDKGIYVRLEFLTENFRLKQHKKRQPKERLSEFYAITVSEWGDYLIKTTSRRIYYSQNNNRAKQFKTEKEAQKYIEHLMKRGFNRCVFGIQKIKNGERVFV